MFKTQLTLYIENRPGELARTFNCGLGLLAFVAPEHAEATTQALGADARAVGRVVAAESGTPKSRILGIETAWRA